MKRYRKIMALILAAASMCVFGGCENTKSSDTDTLVWCLPANDISDKTAVLDEVNKITVPKIGAKVKIQEYDFGTYTEKMRMKMASADSTYDLMFVGYLNSYNEAVKNGVLEPLNKLIEKNAPELKKAIDDYVWVDAVQDDGEIYAVPNTQIMSTQYSFGILKSLAEKYGWTKTEVEKPEELEEFLATVKANEPDIYPYRPNYGLAMWTTKYSQIAGGVCIDEEGPDNVELLRNTPEYQQGIATVRDWFKKGYIRSDVASVGDDNTDFNANRYAVYNSTWKPGQETIYPSYTYVKIGTPRIGNGASLSTMTGINYKSKNKEKAIKLISLMNTDKELYNLMSLGIKDKHYTLGENGKYTPIEDSGYGISGWIIGNQFNALVAYNQDDDVWEQTRKLNKESKSSKLRGFKYDSSKVKPELSSISAVTGEYGAMSNGTRDKDEYWGKMEARLKEVGEDKVIKDTKEQVKEFLENKKK